MSFTGAQNWLYARKIVTQPWTKWFAWRPVKIQEKRVWLKTVYRRQVVCHVDMDNWSYYEYGTIFDILQSK